MDFIRRLRKWPGPPLVLQIMLLLVGGLVVAQLVTLLLTVLLPPSPPPQYDLRDIARVLLDREHTNGAVLKRVVQPGPPAPSGARWLTSDKSRRDLAHLIGTDERYVRLYFYTPMPFAGSAQPPPRLTEWQETPEADEAAPRQRRARLEDGFMPADFQVAQAGPTPGFPGGGFPGGFPGSGFPGGGGGNFPGMGGSFPGGHFPGGGVPGANVPGTGVPGGAIPRPPVDVARPPMQPPAAGAGPSPIVPGAARPPVGERAGGLPGPIAGPVMTGVPTPSFSAAPVLLQPAFRLMAPDIQPPVLADLPPVETPRTARPPRVASTLPWLRRDRTPGRGNRSPMPRTREPGAGAATAGAACRTGRAHPFPVPRGLFGLMPAPFVQGDFVAALELGTGEWAVVQPAPEPFPTVAGSDGSFCGSSSLRHCRAVRLAKPNGVWCIPFRICACGRKTGARSHRIRPGA
ncbi:MAG: hypothetical protein H6924_00010 [Alphaproteobacteria bacterium]|nr:hypothetical protein [Alphaproteobacteria bacterium]